MQGPAKISKDETSFNLERSHPAFQALLHNLLGEMGVRRYVQRLRIRGWPGKWVDRASLQAYLGVTRLGIAAMSISTGFSGYTWCASCRSWVHFLLISCASTTKRRWKNIWWLKTGMIAMVMLQRLTSPRNTVDM